MSAMTTNSVNQHDRGDANHKALVRRFTDELTGSTVLEVETQASQIQQDRDDEEAERSRIQRLQDSFDCTDADQCFDIARIARDELEKVCNRFAKEQKPTLRFRLGIGKDHKSAKMKANEKLQAALRQTRVNDLQNLVQEANSHWKSNQGVISRNFHRVCGTLEAHQKLFAIFPSENIYTAILCGTLSCIVQASANHNNVAETLSQSVADITDKVATCAQFLCFITTTDMKTRLAAVYSQLFTFYRDTLEWYMQSSTSKFFGSFNAKVNARFQTSIQSIENNIEQIATHAQIGTGAMTRLIYEDIQHVKAEVYRQRQTHRDTSDVDVGAQMLKHLQAMISSTISEQMKIQFQHQSISSHPGNLLIAGAPEKVMTSSREDAIAFSSHLESHIFGDEGHKLIHTGEFPPMEQSVSHKLEDWVPHNQESHPNLWISAPYESDSPTSSARAAAIAIVASAWQAGLPILSHFCKRPPRNAIPESVSVEEAGLLGLVYSLIRQLLQFRVQEPMTSDLSEERFKSLNDDPEASWKLACDILQELLEQTPGIRYCVLDSLNDLEWSCGMERGNEVLDLLFGYQEIAEPSFQILLTTSGQSRLLARRIPFGDRCIATQPGRRVMIDGRSAAFDLLSDGEKVDVDEYSDDSDNDHDES